MKKLKIAALFLALALAACTPKTGTVTTPAATTPGPTVPPQTTPPATLTTTPGPTEPPTLPPTTLPPTTPEPTTPPPTTPPPETMPPFSVTAVASGELVVSNGQAAIDYSNISQGYVMAQYTLENESRLKAQVKGPAGTYTYNLTPQQWAAFPLTQGNGSYQVSILENVTGSRYALVLSHTIQVTLEDEFAPFLHSNQYVNYDCAPDTVEKAWELCHGAAPLKKVEIVYHFVVEGMTYDYDLASSVKSGYLPQLDAVLEKRSGICFDYAALMTGMLRSQGVPCKLVVGYAGEIYHAWISVWSEETGWVEGIVFFDGSVWKRMDPTFASSANGDQEILDYITNDSHYTARYIY